MTTDNVVCLETYRTTGVSRPPGKYKKDSLQEIEQSTRQIIKLTKEMETSEGVKTLLEIASKEQERVSKLKEERKKHNTKTIQRERLK